MVREGQLSLPLNPGLRISKSLSLNLSFTVSNMGLRENFLGNIVPGLK